MTLGILNRSALILRCAQDDTRRIAALFCHPERSEQRERSRRISDSFARSAEPVPDSFSALGS